MKRLTIVKEDNMVGIDGEFYLVDCSSLPANFHALQWYGEVEEPYAEVEWNGHPKPPNTEIDNVDEYQFLIDAWNVAKQTAPVIVEPVIDRETTTPTTEVVQGGPTIVN